MTLRALADEIGVDRTTLLKIVDQIEDLGEVKKYRPNGRGPITLFYSPRQQDKIRQATTEKYKSSRPKGCQSHLVVIPSGSQTADGKLPFSQLVQYVFPVQLLCHFLKHISYQLFVLSLAYG